ncbi:hypothetical protein [Halorientalis marina]|uniref:hypothetical protein n=1 Tax=Halorientalis marina TaxID=2931976 RepID=UPI001FF17AFB|nr:hypothetical protein [Halorientalis marina]
MTDEPQSDDDDQPDESGKTGLPEKMEREVESFLGQFDATRQFLDELQTQQVQGQDAEVREQLRQWADRKPGQYTVLFHTLVTGERFRQDVKVNFGSKVATALEKLQDQYSSLSYDFFLIRLERVYGLYRSDLRAIVTDAVPAEQDGMPVLSVEYREGSAVVAESQQEPSQALVTAANLTQAVAELLTTEQDEWDQQHPAELRGQKEAIERLTDAVEQLPDVEEAEVETRDAANVDTTDADQSSPSLLEHDPGSYRDRDDPSESERPTYIQ